MNSNRPPRRPPPDGAAPRGPRPAADPDARPPATDPWGQAARTLEQHGGRDGLRNAQRRREREARRPEANGGAHAPGDAARDARPTHGVSPAAAIPPARGTHPDSGAVPAQNGIDDDGTLHYFAPCPRGLEQALAEELRQIGARVDAVSAAGISFSGDRAVGYEANLRSRIASRILRRVGEGRYRGDDDLYRLAMRCEWERWFDPGMTLRVDVSAIRSPLRSLNFATLRVKDGICDRFRHATGARPSIDTAQPDVRVYAFLLEQQATLYLDLSGEPLFKRGWRSDRDDKGEAPLKENLAAGLLALAAWTPEVPLYDPFCGSGTLLIEAAQRACGIAPGLSRRFGFEALLDHDAKLWDELRSKAHRDMSAARPGLFAGSDLDADAIEQTRRNARRAGLPDGLLKLSRRDVSAAHSPFEAPGMIVTNPPYGERLSLRGSADADHAWGEIGRLLKREFAGWRVYMLTSDMRLPQLLGMKERRKPPLYNGALECRLFGFDIRAAREAT